MIEKSSWSTNQGKNRFEKIFLTFRVLNEEAIPLWCLTARARESKPDFLRLVRSNIGAFGNLYCTCKGLLGNHLGWEDSCAYAAYDVILLVVNDATVMPRF